MLVVLDFDPSDLRSKRGNKPITLGGAVAGLCILLPLCRQLKIVNISILPQGAQDQLALAAALFAATYLTQISLGEIGHGTLSLKASLVLLRKLQLAQRLETVSVGADLGFSVGTGGCDQLFRFEGCREKTLEGIACATFKRATFLSIHIATSPPSLSTSTTLFELVPLLLRYLTLSLTAMSYPLPSAAAMDHLLETRLVRLPTTSGLELWSTLESASFVLLFSSSLKSLSLVRCSESSLGTSAILSALATRLAAGELRNMACLELSNIQRIDHPSEVLVALVSACGTANVAIA